MTRKKYKFSVSSLIMTLAVCVLFAGHALASAEDAAGNYCFNMTFNRPMTMNYDGTCPDRATKPEGINQCVIVERQYGNLAIETRENNAIYFNVSMIFPSEYSCELEGTAEATGNNSWRYTETIEDSNGLECVLDITREEDGRITFADPTENCSRYHCGAQAYFFNIGFGPETKGAKCIGDE